MKMITLLPALPEAWSDGYVKGLRARGGFEVEMEWKQGRLVKACIVSDKGGLCRVRKPDGEIIEFETEKGHVYDLMNPGFNA
ncbi:glycoside hydrolase family 95-like protein [Thermoclostridium stercorarium]|uniref:glycoside hydrolase family 95-like protein n=1 Tax=Thermoclostridium stercorarium TaxID=1510 RepID=UPI002092ACD0|nr:hypothetical protein [Thermoclostridium stercorarium]